MGALFTAAVELFKAVFASASTKKILRLQKDVKKARKERDAAQERYHSAVAEEARSKVESKVLEAELRRLVGELEQARTAARAAARPLPDNPYEVTSGDRHG